MSPKQIGAELRRARKYRRWSQMLMAGKMGLATSSISRYETKTDELTLRSLLKALDVLDLELVVKSKKHIPEQLRLDI